jgi:ATP-dependent DNA helicase DinG
MVDIADIFSPDGALAASLPGFSYRKAQQEMATLVADALSMGKHAAIEAGTGIGKTFAYLVPVLVSGRRAIISTGTRTLQDQLFARDLPLLGALLGRPVRIALLKGRGNYLCWHRLEAALHDGTRDAATLAELRAIANWGRASARGDLTELEDLENDDGLRGAITSTVDNCLGSKCDFYDQCFVAEARRDAQAADVVIVNHHLLLADLALKDGGFGELLPGADAVIVDEAHQLPDVAQQFFGLSASTREIESLLRDLNVEARGVGVAGEVEQAASDVARAVLDLRRCSTSVPPGRTPWAAAPAALRDALPEVRRALETLREAVDGFADASAALANCAQRCADAAARVRFIAAADPDDGLRWFDFSTGAVAAHWTPFDVGAALAARIEAQGGAWVFASATLAVGEDFSHFLRRVGVDAQITRVLASPFDYERNARLYVPEALPDPSDESYVEELMGAVWPLIDAAGGGAFLLFTSYRALNRAETWLQRCATPGRVLVQGRGSRSELLNEFRRDGNAILLGTSSFWQGVDVRGPALRLVVIDKLPFASPGDPLVQARIDAIRRANGDAFTEFQLPQAVLALKQGVGRLIRDFDDRGLVVLGDPRLRTRGYGRLFLASLPPMPVLDDHGSALAFAASLDPARSVEHAERVHTAAAS